MTRNPALDPTPLDRASFYLEDLKFGPQAGRLARVGFDQLAAQLEVLLRDARIDCMTGQALLDASEFYAQSFSSLLRLPLLLTRSVFFEGLMHGIALAGGLQGELRDEATP